MYEDMADVLAGLHGVDVAGVGLADYGKPGNYYLASDRPMGAAIRLRQKPTRSRRWIA